MIPYATRVDRLPPYIFADLEQLEEQMAKRGVDMISLGIGDPDPSPPAVVLEALRAALTEPGSNNYSSSAGEAYFRQAVAEWYRKRFNVTLNPDTQVCALIGSKEGIANVGRLMLNDGDIALLPDPGYPVYAQGSTLLADGVPVHYPLKAETGFQPDFDRMPVDERSKLIFLNYPSNPTGAVAETDTLTEAVDFCKQHHLLLCYDNAYSEVSFDSYRSPSALQVDEACDCTVEFNSCSKMFCMTGYRVGFAVGNEKVIAGLKKVKAQVDSGVPKFVQRAAATALNRYFDPDFVQIVTEMNRMFKERLEILAKGIQEAGFDASIPKATFYLWVNVGISGADFARKLLTLGVAATPGEAFGSTGREYVRFSVTQPSTKIRTAAERISNMKRANPIHA